MKRLALFFVAFAAVATLAHADQAPMASPPPVVPPTAAASAPLPLPAPASPPASASPPAGVAPVAAPPPSVAPVEAPPNAAARPPFALLSAELGAQHLNLTAFKSPDASSLAVGGSDTGVLVGVAIDVPVRPLVLGVRARLAHFSASNYWNVGPEAGVRLAFDAIEPYALVSFGYASVAGLGSVFGTGANGLPVATGDLGAHGYDLRLSTGADYRVSRLLGLGVLLSAEVVHMGYSVSGTSISGAATTGLATSASVVASTAF